MVPPTIRYLLLLAFCCTPIALLFVLICCCDDGYPTEPQVRKPVAVAQSAPAKKTTEKID